MIRLIQRRLIVPRGDTGTFSIPVLAGKDNGDASVFTIFDPLTHRKVFEKVMELSDGVLTMDLTHGDTVNLPVGQYVWDIKFYTDAVFDEDGRVASGTEVDSYYAAFQLPICEIRETGDNLLLADDAPDARLAPDQINYLDLVRGQAEESAQNAANSAAEADTSATNAEGSASAAAASLQAAQDIETSVLAAQETASAAAVSAQSSADLASQKAAQIEADLASKADKSEIPTKVSDLTDDSGHYTKPANGIPASDLEETYLTQHQDLSNYVQKTDYATLDSAGIVKFNPSYGIVADANTHELQLRLAASSDIKNGTANYYAITPSRQHIATFYGLAKVAGHDEASNYHFGTYTDEAKAAIQQMLGVPSTSDIPTNVSDLTNDAGYLTEHQDISGKANVTDLAAVATSGDYDDLINKPTIPEAPVQDVQVNGTSALDQNGVASIPVGAKGVFGVVKAQNGEGILISSGTLKLSTPSSIEVKEGDNGKKAIVPYNQHYATFYGLAKAAGYDEKDSELPIGQYTDGAKTAIQTMLDVPSNASMTTAIGNAIGNINSFDMAVVQELPTQDISTHTIYLVPKTGETNDVYDEYVYINSAWEMVGNTQVDLSNYVQKTDYATSSEAGVVKAFTSGGAYGVYLDSYKILKIWPSKGADIKSPSNSNFAPIIPATQHYAVFYGLAKAAGDTTQSQSDNAVGTYTTEAKAAIRSMIGAAASADVTVQDVQVNGTSILNNGIANVPMAGKNINGVIKVQNETVQEAIVNGGSILLNGILTVVGTSDEYALKGGIDQAALISAAYQHKSTFYGLAKAAGIAGTSAGNTVGTYTDAAKAAIQQMLGVPSVSDIPDVPVEDVQVNGTSIVSNGVANIPVGDTSTVGVVKLTPQNFSTTNGQVTLLGNKDEEYKSGLSGWAKGVKPNSINVLTFYGLAKAAGDTSQSQSNNEVGSYTDTAKGAIQKMLGISNLIAPEENDLVADQAYAIGDIFTSGGKLYKATSAIAFGGTIVPTTNCVETNVIDEVAAKLDAAEAGLKVVRLI